MQHLGALLFAQSSLSGRATASLVQARSALNVRRQVGSPLLVLQVIYLIDLALDVHDLHDQHARLVFVKLCRLLECLLPVIFPFPLLPLLDAAQQFPTVVVLNLLLSLQP
jgi:hypothetical protein